MYTFADRILDISDSFRRKAGKRPVWLQIDKKFRKLAWNDAKTAGFAKTRPHCYIMATMGLKHSVYVKIYAAECLFRVRKPSENQGRRTRES